MSILSKIWSILKSIFAALTKEPENNQLDVGIPASEDEVSTDAPADVVTPAADPAPVVQPEPPAPDASQSN